MTRIVPCLWHSPAADEAARFYAGLLPDSRIDKVTRLGDAGPTIVEFTLVGRPFLALAADTIAAATHAVSMMVECDDQAEIDRLWAALSEGGHTERCGWLKDRWGLSWQIVPRALGVMMADPDRAAAGRVGAAMMQMVKFDIEALERAHRGA